MKNAQLLAIIACLFAFIGCSQFEDPPENWYVTLPGKYVGSSNGLKEGLEFKSDGTYIHTLSDDNKLAHEDKGEWKVLTNKFQIVLHPSANEHFIEFYNPTNHSLARTGKKWAGFYFYPHAENGKFNVIYSNPEFPLTRIGAEL